MNTMQTTTTGTKAAELDNAEREAEGVKRFPWLFETDDSDESESQEQ